MKFPRIQGVGSTGYSRDNIRTNMATAPRNTDEQTVMVTIKTHSALPRSTANIKMSESIRMNTPMRKPPCPMLVSMV